MSYERVSPGIYRNEQGQTMRPRGGVMPQQQQPARQRQPMQQAQPMQPNMQQKALDSAYGQLGASPTTAPMGVANGLRERMGGFGQQSPGWRGGQMQQPPAWGQAQLSQQEQQSYSTQMPRPTGGQLQPPMQGGVNPGYGPGQNQGTAMPRPTQPPQGGQMQPMTQYQPQNPAGGMNAETAALAARYGKPQPPTGGMY